jgi:hypothetical protein
MKLFSGRRFNKQWEANRRGVLRMLAGSTEIVKDTKSLHTRIPTLGFLM